MDLPMFRARLAITAQHLADAGRVADLAGETAHVSALDQLRRAASGVEDLIRLCNGDATPTMRDCPACTKAVRAAATLCGYCWTRLTPVSP
jgi:hypothetical protein